MIISNNELLKAVEDRKKSLIQTLGLNKKEFYDNFEAILVTLYLTNSKLEDIDNKALTNICVKYGDTDITLSRAEISVLEEIRLYDNAYRRGEYSNEHISKKELLDRLVKINHANGHYLLNKMSIGGSKKTRDKGKIGLGLIEEIKYKKGENTRSFEVGLTKKGNYVFDEILQSYQSSRLAKFQSDLSVIDIKSDNSLQKLELTYGLLSYLESFYKELVKVEK